MKIIILGAGVIGTASAYFLAKAGHEVTVIERQPAAALETSYANAGEVSPGYSAPWAGPGVPLKAVKWLMMKHSPLAIRPTFDLHTWRWVMQMLMNCTAARYETNKGRMLRMAEYSRDVLQQLRADTGISYDERTQGTLQLFRNQAQLDGAAADIAILQRYEVPYQTLDKAACLQHEPALANVQEKFVGALLLPGDETGDCFKFTQNLAKLAEGLGVRFRYGVSIEKLRYEGDAITSVLTSEGELQADSYVLALGSYSPLMLRELGIHIPVYPIKGYSLTVPIIDAARAPESTVMDETYKVAITRLGDRIRVGGTAEITGYNLDLRKDRRDTLEFSVTDLFPGGGAVESAEFWTGLRPMTPDGTPIIGPTPYRNLFLNTGHGTLGWTMACGSGQFIADLISGKKPQISTEGLYMDRYGSSSKRPLILPKELA
ncbi:MULTISPECIES: D-amino acid dehydrogenase [unclassified Undibacterium]|uniref:D-amino acid dehydrogenase n=1 Tax=unclassified Undibacterium TaxID=2630295 RepID=UPI002AC93554|nr:MULTISPECIES: D-amino acid dehydrogenase [unclassified Undibacterium]MEB0138218.1 D-amino acid dehydrogenase [Undibacterium sp. CCC2.1]MEB0171621.1 D-amino acid dehydrogenase [Undibacterium sp. CCC1.1]MEB0175459.1 D-amino acid dehydrogenase [Undibacterium sp. CCC3.4]MEB0214821.1 D-amino acid dehydrogenase [Undibacterium sp. 5I2]WPX45308.1 D-amino acid dehydrogenase [Undibacterium sp. CCC3.4]